MSVCSTGTYIIYTKLFSPPSKLASLLIFGPLRPGQPTPGSCPSDVSFSLNRRWLRNLNRMCIDYASRPRLSSRLTRSGRTFLLNPQSFGLYDSHINLATHSGILSSMQSTAASAATSPLIRRSPTPLDYSRSPSFGVHFSPVEFSAQGHSTGELLRTLLMFGCF